MLCTYTGSDRRSYPSYLDVSTAQMLEVERGGTYDVMVAPGQPTGLPLPPGDGRWTNPPALPVPAAKAAAQVTPKAAAKPADEEK